MIVFRCCMDLSNSNRQCFGWVYLQVRYLLSSIILQPDCIFPDVFLLISLIGGRHQCFYYAWEAKVSLLFRVELARFRNQRCLFD